MAPRTRSNLRAVKRLAASATADTTANPAVESVLVLAETLAAALDHAVAGGQPGYVLSRLASSYAAVLQLVSQLVAPAWEKDPFAAWMKELSVPTPGGWNGDH